MSKIIQFFNAIYWFFYRIFPKGRRDYTIKKGLENLMSDHEAKMKVVHNANKKMSLRKILGFVKGKSITKAKTSDFKMMQELQKEHGQELKKKGLRLTRKGKFARAQH